MARRSRGGKLSWSAVEDDLVAELPTQPRYDARHLFGVLDISRECRSQHAFFVDHPPPQEEDRDDLDDDKLTIIRPVISRISQA